MIESVLFSVNTVAPIFVIVILGAVLGKCKFFSEDFLTVCDKLVFDVCLPCLIFKNIVGADLSKSLNFNLILFCCVTVIVSVVLLCLLVPIFIKDNRKRGAFIQGAYRSNSTILGITLAENMFPGEGAAAIATVLPLVVVLYNVFAVIELSIFAPSEIKLTKRQFLLKILKTVVQNPLIISIILAFAWIFTVKTVPTVMERSIDYLSSMAAPLALISLGANFRLNSLRGRITPAISSSLIKTALLPLAAVFSAVVMGFRGVPLGIIFVIFGSPAAVSCYIMAKQMKSDHHLAGQIMLISTLVSVFTLFAGVVMLKELRLI